MRIRKLRIKEKLEEIPVGERFILREYDRSTRFIKISNNEYKTYSWGNNRRDQAENIRDTETVVKYLRKNRKYLNKEAFEGYGC